MMSNHATIPQDVLTALVSSLEKPEAPPGGHELRRARRIGLKARVTISPYVLGVPQQPLTVDVRDLSPRGIAIESKVSMQTGQQFIVRLPRAGTSPSDILCAVAHCKPKRAGQFEIGAEFVCMLGDTSTGCHDRADPGEIRRISGNILR